MHLIETYWSHLPVSCKHLILRTFVAALAIVSLLATPSASHADARYKSYASKLMRSLPAHAVVRPDLEAQLNKLASSERRRNGKKPLAVSKAQLRGARAQAAEMLLGNFVGHHTKAGFDFGDRFRAYLPDFEGLRGENAARDRQRGPADARKARRLFKQWLGSRGHRRNLNNSNYRFVSTGVIQVRNHIYAVQIFWERQTKKRSNALFFN